MKLKGLLFTLLIGTAALSFSSCKKTCVIDKENVDSGDIISEVNGYKVVVYNTGYMAGGLGNHITGSHPYSSAIEVSFDDGYTREQINYAIYNVLRYPITVSCEAKVDRNVYIDPTTQTVTYKIEVTECGSCDERYSAENYVLVPAFPQSYTILYDLTVNEVD